MTGVRTIYEEIEQLQDHYRRIDRLKKLATTTGAIDIDAIDDPRDERVLEAIRASDKEDTLYATIGVPLPDGTRVRFTANGQRATNIELDESVARCSVSDTEVKPDEQVVIDASDSNAELVRFDVDGDGDFDRTNDNEFKEAVRYSDFGTSGGSCGNRPADRYLGVSVDNGRAKLTVEGSVSIFPTEPQVGGRVTLTLATRSIPTAYRLRRQQIR